MIAMTGQASREESEIVPFKVRVLPDPIDKGPLKRFRFVLMVFPEFSVTPLELLTFRLGTVFGRPFIVSGCLSGGSPVFKDS